MRNSFYKILSKEELQTILAKVEEFNGDGVCIRIEISDRGYDNSLQNEAMDISVTVPKQFSKCVWTWKRESKY